MQLKDKVFLITGGASGLGEATVRRFIAGGAKVLIADLNQERGRALQNELGKDALCCSVNVCDEAQVQKAVEQAWSTWGALHGAINCAGVGEPGKLIDKEGEPLPLKGFRQTVDINLIGSFNVTRLVVSAMVKNGLEEGRENGVIINTASVAAFDGQIGQIAYSASKGAIVSMTLPLARELARYGIRVMTIAPGMFETPILAGLSEKARQSLQAQVPFPPRLGKPAEFAQLCQQIVENEMLNGECIRLDGAIRLNPR